MHKKKRLCRHVHNSTVSFYVNYIIYIKRLCRHVHNSTVSFCVNYIILITQNIYFFNSQNIYFICQKKSIMQKKNFFTIRHYRFMLII